MPATIDTTTYEDTGINTEAADRGLDGLVQHIKQTWPTGEGIGKVQLDIGYFANVIDMGGTGLAITTDGVGSKALVAQMMNKFDTIGIDCVAMNVNDLICVGAKPVSMVDYIALQDTDPRMLEELAIGLKEGARQAGISISGGEIAQLPDIVKGYDGCIGFDIAGMAVGTVPLDRILIGQGLREGDVVIGVESNGVHSNGLTLARHVLFERSGFTVDTEPSELGRTIGEELLRPTNIYVLDALKLLDARIDVKAFMHITSDGFLNLTRVAAEVGFMIDNLPTPPAIFDLISKRGNVPDEEMFRVFNMGVGFCVVVSESELDETLSLLQTVGHRAFRIGYVIADPERRVRIESRGLVGRGKQFYKV